jgi:hypothetical protein
MSSQVDATGLLKPLANLFSTPDMPAMEKVKTAPDADSETAKKAAQRATARKYAGKGRAGTILSESNLG